MVVIGCHSREGGNLECPLLSRLERPSESEAKPGESEAKPGEGDFGGTLQPGFPLSWENLDSCLRRNDTSFRFSRLKWYKEGRWLGQMGVDGV